MKYEAFSKFMHRKWREFDDQLGRRSSMIEFAARLGYSQPTVSNWLGGRYLPTHKGLRDLAHPDKLGPEIYEYIKISTDPDLIYLNNNWNNLDEEGRRFVRECAEKYLTSQGSDPESEDRMIEIMRLFASEHGYIVREQKISQGKKHAPKSKL